MYSAKKMKCVYHQNEYLVQKMYIFYLDIKQDIINRQQFMVMDHLTHDVHITQKQQNKYFTKKYEVQKSSMVVSALA